MSNNFITYYGEYSLYHWLSMILNKEITLPNFQRNFVWSPQQVIYLMDSFKKGLFVPPILIANYTGDNQESPANYVLDGQQRLSAILLAYLNIFPHRFEEIEDEVEDEDDDNENSNKTKTVKIGYKWDFNQIQDFFEKDSYKYSNNMQYFRKKLLNNNVYIPITDKIIKKQYKNKINDKDISLYNSIQIDENFLKNKFLGYSFIKSTKPNAEKEKKLFANIFKNINTQAVKLKNEESRAALYWLAGDKRSFFEPEFIQDIKINHDKIDFVQYLALCADAYNKDSQGLIVDNEFGSVAIGYARPKKREDYTVRYVNSVIENTDDSIFGEFSKIFPNYEADYKNFEKIFINQKYPTLYKNKITADIYLFGLIFWVLFHKRKIQFSETLFNKLKETEKYYNENIPKSSSNKMYAIRARLGMSIDVYEHFLEK